MPTATPKRKLAKHERASKRPKRKLAPSIAVSDLSSVNLEREKIISRHMQSLPADQRPKGRMIDNAWEETQPGTWHYFYGDREKLREYELMGYKRAVLPADNGGAPEELHHKGDPLLIIEQEKFRAHMNKGELQSRRIVEQSLKGQGPTDRGVPDAEGHVHYLRADDDD